MVADALPSSYVCQVEEKFHVAGLESFPSKCHGVGQPVGVTLYHAYGEENRRVVSALHDARDKVLTLVALRVEEVHAIHVAVSKAVSAVPLVNLLATLVDVHLNFEATLVGRQE